MSQSTSIHKKMERVREEDLSARSPPRLQTGYLLGSPKFKLPRVTATTVATCTTRSQRNGVAFASSTWGRTGANRVFVRKMDKVCNYWVQGNCSYGDTCNYLHSWSMGDCVSLLTTLEGHQKVVSGIALPSGSDKLYTGSKDESVRVWDCQSAQCLGVINLGGEVGWMISEGPLIFIGIPNAVKVWSLENRAYFSCDVCSLLGLVSFIMFFGEKN